MMVNQLPGAAFEPEDVSRALVKRDHRALRRPQLTGLDADRIAHVFTSDDLHIPLFDIAAGIESDHVLKSRVNFVPSGRVAARRAQARDIWAMGPYGAHRTQVAVQGGIERGIKKESRGTDFILGRRRRFGSLRLSACGLRSEAERRYCNHDEEQISPIR